MAGGKISFLFHVCILKMFRFSWGIQICVQKMQKASPLPPPSSPPKLAVGTGPPHMCVQNDQCDEGIILRYGCWGTRDPSPAPPPPPRLRAPPQPLQVTKLGGVGVGDCTWAPPMGRLRDM